ncbi:MAG: hypothetical protein LJE69_13445 [Thiohalocapsa sp.]|uniref:hypothetical protein n=1 Tax=Thiohalocapsa sp. TaxID=2497641 RepID=UPI0025D6194C|nr:hypothetical protein [Thiohalocapsa sp.]MCG6942242.1 hypothetical protein [Thiohalocapsa sp.]
MWQILPIEAPVELPLEFPEAVSAHDGSGNQFWGACFVNVSLSSEVDSHRVHNLVVQPKHLEKHSLEALQSHFFVRPLKLFALKLQFLALHQNCDNQSSEGHAPGAMPLPERVGIGVEILHLPAEGRPQGRAGHAQVRIILAVPRALIAEVEVDDVGEHRPVALAYLAGGHGAELKVLQIVVRADLGADAEIAEVGPQNPSVDRAAEIR